MSIATLREGPLHASLKTWYARPGDRFEVHVAGRQIDIVRGDLLIEIQTGNLAALRRKLEALTEQHPVRVVHPVALEKWILRVEAGTDRLLSRRKSPRRGKVEDAFRELVSLAKLLARPNLSCEILLTREEELRVHSPGRAWRRRGWVTVERRLLEVVEGRLFRDRRDLRRLLPPILPVPFTTADLSGCLDISSDLAQRMAYCLRHAGVITVEGKRGNARTYSVSRR